MEQGIFLTEQGIIFAEQGILAPAIHFDGSDLAPPGDEWTAFRENRS
jgi:hypothetical protein